MAVENSSTGDGAMSDSVAQDRISAPSRLRELAPDFPLRSESLTLGELVDIYLASYAGRDRTRMQRLNWWVARLGHLALPELTDDEVHAELQKLAQQPARYYLGKDAEGLPIYKSKGRPLSPASVNRYSAALGALLTWAIKKRITPKGYVHPCKTVERQRENNEKTRFLSEAEIQRLLSVSRKSKWPRLYLLVLLALTTGARKGELLGLRWSDLDLDRSVAYCARTKNGDARCLPLLPAVVDEIKKVGVKSGTADLIFRSKKSSHRPYVFEGRWRAALREARIREFRFHDLRHTCASMLAQEGATLLEIADVLGHRQLQVTKRYSHLTTNHKSALLHRVLGQIS